MSSSSNRSIQWAKDNPIKYKENQKRYRDKKKLLMTAEDRELQLAKQREASKLWRISNPDKIRERKRDYVRKRRKEDPEFRNKLNERKRKWDDEHIEHIKQYSKDRYSKTYKNDDIFRRNFLDRIRDKSINNRLEVIYYYSNGSMKCERCGESHYEFLAIDHIDNNGYDHRNSGELRKYSNDISKYILANNFPEEYQILCHNCNQIKRMELIPIKDTVWGKHRKKRRLLMLNKYSNNNIKCIYCGENNINCLTFHHVKGGGMKEKRDIGYTNIYDYLYHNDIPLSDIAVACQNCNKSLGHYGYLPF